MKGHTNDTVFVGEQRGSREVLSEGWKTVFTYKISDLDLSSFGSDGLDGEISRSEGL